MIIWCSFKLTQKNIHMLVHIEKLGCVAIVRFQKVCGETHLQCCVSGAGVDNSSLAGSEYRGEGPSICFIHVF